MDDREAQIRDRAYAMWELEGRPDGKDEEIWQRAEQEVLAEENAQGTHQAGGAETEARAWNTADAAAKDRPARADVPPGDPADIASGGGPA